MTARTPPRVVLRTATGSPIEQSSSPARGEGGEWEERAEEKERRQRRNERKRKKGILQSRVYKETFGVEKVSEFLAGMKKK